MKRPLNAYNDVELFSAMKGNSRESQSAFAELYARYSPRIFAYCRRITGSREGAQDAFQETFAKFFHSAQEERDMVNVPAFLLRIARNVCLNMKRSAKTTLELEDYHLPSSDIRYEQKELLSLIDAALELLPHDYREAFVLREYDGLSYQEIADVTDSTMATAKIRIFRAKQKIRDILSPYLQDLKKAGFGSE